MQGQLYHYPWFSPHTTHRMQPLDVSFFGPLKTAYSNVCNDFLTMNPGQTVAVRNVPSLFHKAYAKAATLNNAVKGFEAAGIVPSIHKFSQLKNLNLL